MTPDVDRYVAQSPWTDPGRFASHLREIPPEPAAIVRVVSGLLLHPWVAPLRGVFVPEHALDDRKIRSVEQILGRLIARDARELTAPRAPAEHAFCVCAGFARVATAVFRAHGLPARCRAGFAAYFNPGFLEDHWVSEYWDGAAWRLLDAQLDDAAVREQHIAFSPVDVPRDQFLDGSTAWQGVRAGAIDPTRIGLSPIGLSGAAFVAGAVMLDAAALNKEEMLPWEKWSIGRELPPGREVPADWATRFDRVAALLAGTPDGAVAARVYEAEPWLRVTPTVASFADGAPVELAVAP